MAERSNIRVTQSQAKKGLSVSALDKIFVNPLPPYRGGGLLAYTKEVIEFFRRGQSTYKGLDPAAKMDWMRAGKLSDLLKGYAKEVYFAESPQAAAAEWESVTAPARAIKTIASLTLAAGGYAGGLGGPGGIQGAGAGLQLGNAINSGDVGGIIEGISGVGGTGIEIPKLPQDLLDFGKNLNDAISNSTKNLKNQISSLPDKFDVQSIDIGAGIKTDSKQMLYLGIGALIIGGILIYGRR